MHLVVQYEDSEFEVTVEIPPGPAQLGSLVSAWTGHRPRRIHVDGRSVDASIPLAEVGLRTGSVVEIDVPGDPAAPAASRGRPGGVFNRPPRAVQPSSPPSIELPALPGEPVRASRFSWGAMVVPIVLGVVMAVVVHPRMAMFAVFSPAMLAANWLEDHRRHKRERRQTGEGYRRALTDLAAEAKDARDRELAARWSRVWLPQTLRDRAEAVHPRLWERRPHHADFMEIPAGTGCIPWEPPVQGTPTAAIRAELAALGELHDAPWELRFSPGEVVGIAGRRSPALMAARQLVLQAAVNHGPCDLAISIVTENADDWDWAKWLPHTMGGAGGNRRLAATKDEIAAVASMLPDGRKQVSPHRHLVIVDLPDLVGSDRDLIREKLRDGLELGITGLAVARRTDDLPSLTSTIISVAGDDSWIWTRDGECRRLSCWGSSEQAARRTARALSRLEDPEAAVAGAGLPGEVHLTSLLETSPLDMGDDLVGSISSLWARRTGGPATPIGLAEEGTVMIDLVADGPHGLFGGTTGSGKSELLRTLVAGLAVNHGPDKLNFVLIDYKGGSAFDACAELPHTVGVVTDLDDHLAERALTCLGAELRYREGRLRAAGLSDVADIDASGAEPLPRLVVVIDEFASLAAELPDFLQALVGIAQRGRSLGVHLLLATQRPAGVVTEPIKANTNLRIALRVQEVADSVDVVGSKGAAEISRRYPGRALARFGPGDVAVFQTAVVTGRSIGAGSDPMRTTPFVFALEQPVPPPGAGRADGPSDLERIVAAARRAAEAMEMPSPRRPWPDPLPALIGRDGLDCCGAAGTAFGLADEPHRQRQIAVMWSPASGNLLLYGLPGSGTSTALATLAVGLCHDHDPGRLHLYVLDFDDQHLQPLRHLPHVGAVVAGAERERQVRLLRRLADELQRRRDLVASDPAALGGHPVIVSMLDNYGAFAASFDSPGDTAIRDLLTRLVADGPGVGMLSVIAAKQPGDVPARLASLVDAKLGFRLADRYEYAGIGIPLVAPPETPGRAFESGTGREVQVAVPHPDGLESAVAGIGRSRVAPAPWSIDVLPSQVEVGVFAAAGRIGAGEWFLPLGIGDSTLGPVGLLLREGEHALVTGPTRSGKSTALMTLAAVARAALPGVRISAILPRRSPVGGCPAVDEVIEPEALDRLGERHGPHLLLVDDAELVEDARLSHLIRERRAGIRVVAAGTADSLRTLYGHWTQEVRRSRAGCALRPNLVVDGDLWQTPLPKRGPNRFPAGRGYLLCDGEVELVQLGMH